MRRWVEANSWTLGLAVLLALLLVATKVIQPEFGVSGLDNLARSALPFALATAGMAVVVIAGGIDLSIAAMMAVASVTAAVLMQGATDGEAALVVLAVLALGAGMGAVNGALIVLTRVPDIVVTLAMLFVWQGVALLILNAPGGAAAPWLRDLIVGGVTLAGRAARADGMAAEGRGLPGRCGRADLAAGPPVEAGPADLCHRVRSAGGLPFRRAGRAHAGGGLCHLRPFRSAWRADRHHGHRHRRADPRALPPHLGRRRGAGGRGAGRRAGGASGPILAIFILRLVRMDLTLLSVDPNVAAIIEGTIMVGVVIFGGVLAMRGARRDKGG